ncbi:MAG: 6-phosphogluconate dehydrogenase [Bacteroidota bacterium]
MSIQLEQAKITAGKFARRALWILSIGFVLFLGGYYMYRTYTISEGTRTGTLFKISKKGVVFKTYEGQLHLGGSAVMTQQSVWDFSAANGDVYNTLQNYEGKIVKCHYKQMVHAFPWQGDTNYIVYEAEAVTQ